MEEQENKIRVKILGSGTSQGSPVIGCNCAVCQSDNKRDQRLRTSILLSKAGEHMVVDTGPDFRQQMLRIRQSQLDAIFITHEHNDHIIGIDDIRPFNFMAGRDLSVYCDKRVAKALRDRFSYAFSDKPYPGAPRLELVEINEHTKYEIAGMVFTPVSYLHGAMPVTGFRTGDFAYLTDIKSITPPELEKVKGSKTVIIGALRRELHYSHMNLDEALELIEKINPERAFLTHVSHRMGLYEEVEKDLPDNVQLAYDGLEIWV